MRYSRTNGKKMGLVLIKLKPDYEENPPWCECGKCVTWPRLSMVVCCRHCDVWHTKEELQRITESQIMLDLMRPAPIRVMYCNYTIVHCKYCKNVELSLWVDKKRYLSELSIYVTLTLYQSMQVTIWPCVLKEQQKRNNYNKSFSSGPLLAIAVSLQSSYLFYTLAWKTVFFYFSPPQLCGVPCLMFLLSKNTRFFCASTTLYKEVATSVWHHTQYFIEATLIFYFRTNKVRCLDDPTRCRVDPG